MEKEMIIKNGANVNGTSYKTSVITTKNKVTELFGEPTWHNNDISEKVQYEWEFGIKQDDGTLKPITLYDWKEDRDFNDDEMIEWHIGAIDSTIALEFADYVKHKLDVNK